MHDATPLTPGPLLAIETSNPTAWEASHPPGTGPGVALAIVGGSGSIDHVDTERVDPTRLHEDMLAAAIDAVTRRQGVRPRDLRHVAVSVGPGGFTSIRVAVTTAKLIAEATGAICIPVPTALVAVAALPHDAACPAVALASKGATAWIAVISRDRRAVTSAGVSDGSDVRSLGVTDLLADRFLPDPIRQRALDASVAIHPLILSAAACARAAMGGRPVDPVALVPIYPREPEAVTKWRELRGKH